MVGENVPFRPIRYVELNGSYLKAAVQIWGINAYFVPTGDFRAIKKATSIEMASTPGLYVKRWQRRATAELQGIKTVYAGQTRCQRVLLRIVLGWRVLGPMLLRMY